MTDSAPGRCPVCGAMGYVIASDELSAADEQPPPKHRHAATLAMVRAVGMPCRVRRWKCSTACPGRWASIEINLEALAQCRGYETSCNEEGECL
mgnify:CR=1 FL=1